jgi:hypothetical protein
MTRKNATVTRTALTFSHADAPPLGVADFPLRSAETVLPLLERSEAGFFEATGGTGRWIGIRPATRTGEPGEI